MPGGTPSCRPSSLPHHPTPSGSHFPAPTGTGRSAGSFRTCVLRDDQRAEGRPAQGGGRSPPEEAAGLPACAPACRAPYLDQFCRCHADRTPCHSPWQRTFGRLFEASCLQLVTSPPSPPPAPRRHVVGTVEDRVCEQGCSVTWQEPMWVPAQATPPRATDAAAMPPLHTCATPGRRSACPCDRTCPGLQPRETAWPEGSAEDPPSRSSDPGQLGRLSRGVPSWGAGSPSPSPAQPLSPVRVPAAGTRPGTEVGQSREAGPLGAAGTGPAVLAGGAGARHPLLGSQPRPPRSGRRGGGRGCLTTTGTESFGPVDGPAGQAGLRPPPESIETPNPTTTRPPGRTWGRGDRGPKLRGCEKLHPPGDLEARLSHLSVPAPTHAGSTPRPRGAKPPLALPRG